MRFGLVGAITIMVSFSLADRFVETAKAWSIIGVKWSDAVLLKDVGKVAVAAAVAAIAALFTRSVLISANLASFGVLATCGLAFGFIYLVAVALLRIVTPGERTAIRQKIVALQVRKAAVRVPNLNEAS